MKVTLDKNFANGFEYGRKVFEKLKTEPKGTEIIIDKKPPRFFDGFAEARITFGYKYDIHTHWEISNEGNLVITKY